MDVTQKFEVHVCKENLKGRKAEGVYKVLDENENENLRNRRENMFQKEMKGTHR